MLKSKACHLKNLSPAQLIEKGEQETEWGGFFITGGHERLIRMLQTTRRNYPVSMQRPSWKNRGKNFSDLGISIGKLFFGLFTALWAEGGWKLKLIRVHATEYEICVTKYLLVRKKTQAASGNIRNNIF